MGQVQSKPKGAADKYYRLNAKGATITQSIKDASGNYVYGTPTSAFQANLLSLKVREMSTPNGVKLFVDMLFFDKSTGAIESLSMSQSQVSAGVINSLYSFYSGADQSGTPIVSPDPSRRLWGRNINLSFYLKDIGGPNGKVCNAAIRVADVGKDNASQQDNTTGWAYDASISKGLADKLNPVMFTSYVTMLNNQLAAEAAAAGMPQILESRLVAEAPMQPPTQQQYAQQPTQPPVQQQYAQQPTQQPPAQQYAQQPPAQHQPMQPPAQQYAQQPPAQQQPMQPPAQQQPMQPPAQQYAQQPPAQQQPMQPPAQQQPMQPPAQQYAQQPPAQQQPMQPPAQQQYTQQPPAVSQGVSQAVSQPQGLNPTPPQQPPVQQQPQQQAGLVPAAPSDDDLPF